MPAIYKWSTLPGDDGASSETFEGCLLSDKTGACACPEDVAEGEGDEAKLVPSENKVPHLVHVFGCDTEFTSKHAAREFVMLMQDAAERHEKVPVVSEIKPVEHKVATIEALLS